MLNKGAAVSDAPCFKLGTRSRPVETNVADERPIHLSIGSLLDVNLNGGQRPPLFEIFRFTRSKTSRLRRHATKMPRRKIPQR